MTRPLPQVLLSFLLSSVWAGPALALPLGGFRRPPAPAGLAALNGDLFSQCDERWRETRLDHFSWVSGPATQPC